MRDNLSAKTRFDNIQDASIHCDTFEFCEDVEDQMKCLEVTLFEKCKIHTSFKQELVF